MSRPLGLAASVAVVGAVLTAAPVSSAAPASSTAHPVAFRVTTIPAVSHARFEFHDDVQLTGRDGSTTFVASAGSTSELQNPYGLSHAVHFTPRRMSDGRVYRLQRWYSKTIHGERTLVATLQEFVPTTIRFVDPNAGPFAPRKVGRVVVKRNDGAVFTFRGLQLEHPVLLQATRVVPLNAGLVSKELLYRVQSVTIAGNNVVNRSQQAFQPADSPSVRLHLLFYSARFSVRDRLFGFGTGSALRLRYPNGDTHVYRLGGSHTVALAALPRGTYHVRIDAPGLDVTTPVAMTRDQVVTLKVFSYLDIAVILAALFAVAAGLLLVGRPTLRARVRALGRRSAGKRKERTVTA